MSIENKEFIDKLEAHVVKAEAGVKYALDRFDILIISLSSGGLVLSLGILEKFPYVDKSLVNLAWLFFSAGLISNLFSQITGYRANKIDIECTKIYIDEIKGNKPDGEHAKIDIVKDKYNFITYILNAISFICLTAAIILLIIFVNIKIY